MYECVCVCVCVCMCVCVCIGRLVKLSHIQWYLGIQATQVTSTKYSENLLRYLSIRLSYKRC